MTTKSRRRRTPSRGRADLSHLRRMTEAEIEATSPEELAGLTADFWAQATVVTPVPKRAISLRVDEDVLAWFKAAGPPLPVAHERRPAQLHDARSQAAAWRGVVLRRPRLGRSASWCPGRVRSSRRSREP